MTEFLIQMVGETDWALFEAHNAIEAVAQAADCDVHAVCLPIWRQGPDRWHDRYEVECYMPLDNSGRQWLVRRGQ